MKKNILSISLLAATLFFISIAAQSQSELARSQSDRLGYVVTDSARGGTKWHFLRSIDLRTGIYSNILLRLLAGSDTLPVNPANPSFRNAVAAIAYDKRNQRVYFTPTFTDRLSYVDLRTMRIRLVSNNFTGLFPKTDDQSNIITRMTIAEDDKGYALTNDGKHLVRFSTSGNRISDLGSLVNHPSNGVMSVHSACSSFGGDIIADDDGNLYLITSANHIFKIDIRTRVARYLGTVNGLPAGFVTSGVTVDPEEEKLILVSSVDITDVYTLNLRTFFAKGFKSYNPRYAADLAGSGILETRDHHHKGSSEIFVDSDETNDKIQLYPNPVTTNQFKIEFTDAMAGSYKLEIIDAKGLIVMTKMVTTGSKSSIVSVALPEIAGKGIFIVRVTNKDSKTVFNQKILLQ